MDTTMEEAEELATDRGEWRQRVVQRSRHLYSAGRGLWVEL